MIYIKKLKRISETIFQEVEEVENGSRPLEWRRSLNFISFPLKNISIVTSCSIHDTEIDWDLKNPEAPLKLIKANITGQIQIRGLVDEEKMRDVIYFAVRDKESEEEIFSVERPSGNIEVLIRMGEPSEEAEKIPADIYQGNACRLGLEPGEDGIRLDLSAPREQLLSLVEALRLDPLSTVDIGAHLLSYSNEMDDSLREWYHPRGLVIRESTSCVLGWASVSTKIGKHKSETDLEDIKVGTDDGNTAHAQANLLNMQEQLEVLSRPLGKLVVAMWVLIIVVALSS